MSQNANSAVEAMSAHAVSNENMCSPESNSAKTPSEPSNSKNSGVSKGTPASSSASRPNTTPLSVDPNLEAKIEDEVKELKRVLSLEPPLCEIPQLSEGDQNVSVGDKLGRKQVAKWVEGSRLTLTQMSEKIREAVFGSKEESEPMSIRNLILNVATRKFYGPKGNSPSVAIDPFDDETMDPYWFWEVRALGDVPEDVRKPAQLARKKRKQIQERLSVVAEVSKLLSDEPNRKKAKLKKTLEKMASTPMLDVILAGLKSAEIGFAQKLADKQKKEQERAALKSAQKEKKREKKQAEAAGFASTKSLSKAQNMFKGFFKTSSKPVELEFDDEMEAVASEKAPLPYRQLFNPCPNDRRLSYVPCNMETMTSEMKRQRSEQEQEQCRLDMFSCWQSQKNRPKKVKGLPPSWARHPNVTADNFECMDIQEIDRNGQLHDVQAKRRKFLWFPSESDCPPYYGSWSLPDQIDPRNPFRKLPHLDYEEMLDEGWDEEPEGESLSEDDDGDEEAGEENEAGDGFIVDDGYLSEDEGFKEALDLEQMIDNDLEEASALSSCPSFTRHEKQLRVLESLVRNGRKCGKLVVVSRLQIANGNSKGGTDGVLSGDSELLKALQSIRIGKEDKICVPSVQQASVQTPVQKKGGDKRATGMGPGRPKLDLTPQLAEDLATLLTKFQGGKEKVVETFLSRHPGVKVAKTRLREKIVELAEYNKVQKAWMLKPEVARARGVSGTSVGEPNGELQTSPAPVRSSMTCSSTPPPILRPTNSTTQNLPPETVIDLTRQTSLKRPREQCSNKEMSEKCEESVAKRLKE